MTRIFFCIWFAPYKSRIFCLHHFHPLILVWKYWNGYYLWSGLQSHHGFVMMESLHELCGYCSLQTLISSNSQPPNLLFIFSNSSHSLYSFYLQLFLNHFLYLIFTLNISIIIIVLPMFNSLSTHLLFTYKNIPSLGGRTSLSELTQPIDLVKRIGICWDQFVFLLSKTKVYFNK